MSNARDKANIPALNFSSTGIDDNATSTAITIDSGENVGIGTSSPSEKLEVYGTEASDGIEILLTNVGEGGGTTTPYTAIRSRLNPIRNGGEIRFGRDSVYTGESTSDSNLQFYTAVNNVNTERMRIDSSGNVGIGTTTTRTNALLNVNGGINSETGLLGRALNDTFTLNGQTQPNYGVNFSASIGVPSGISGYRGLAFATNATERMRIDSSGKIGINNTNPLYYLDIKDTSSVTPTMVQIEATGATSQPMHILNFSNGNDPGGKYFSFRDSGGEKGHISAAGGSAIGYYTSSDHRLKENVVTMPNATDRLKQLKPKRFNFIASADTTVDGFLAHEVSSVVPEAITGTKDAVQVWEEGEELPEGVSVGDNKLDENGNTIPKYQGIDQAKLVPLLVKTIQELEARITTLENA